MKSPARILLLLTLARILPAQTPAEYHRRADAALQSFLLHFWSQGQEYLKAASPDDGKLTGYWTFAQGLDAVLDGAERTEGASYTGLIETLYDAQDARGWLVDYYDDETWMALALIRAHDLTGDARYLLTAESLFTDIRGGWDTSCCGSSKGGVWWNKPHTQKATASNAGVVILAARLYQRTQIASYLGFAKQVYDYWLEYMVDPSSHQVTDHIEPDGTKVYWKFTYNEGLMIGAGVELYGAMQDEQYLTTAKQIASFLLAHETASTKFGSILDDGTNGSCTLDCAQFKGPACRYVKQLFDRTGSSSYLNLLKASANAIWDLARSPAENLFSVSWAGPLMTSFSEQQVCAAVMGLNLYAELAGAYPGTGAPPNRYEAEDAAIHGVGLEADHTGFTGWGYVAGWNGQGQHVDFKVRVPVTGAYDIVFRYAGGAGNASRLIRIDGAIAAPNLVFPGTGSWDNYGTVALQRSFSAGTSAISVIHEPGLGSENYLNLDHLRIQSVLRYFQRSDANSDGVVDVSDAVAIVLFLFGGDPNSVSCRTAADTDGNGQVNVGDAIYLLRYLFLLGAEPRAPFPGCGSDTVAGGVPCASYPPCE